MCVGILNLFLNMNWGKGNSFNLSNQYLSMIHRYKADEFIQKKIYTFPTKLNSW